MKYIKYNKKTKGFSLLEVMAAILVIAIGIIGTVNLMTYSMHGAEIGKARIIAAGLAQEGLEIVENIRASNWFGDLAWNDSLDAGIWRAQYNMPNLMVSSDTVLQLNSKNFYGYQGVGGFTAVSNTPFKRKITISNINFDAKGDPYEIKVVSEVAWEKGGKPYNVNAEVRLYNWFRYFYGAY